MEEWAEVIKIVLTGVYVGFGVGIGVSFYLQFVKLVGQVQTLAALWFKSAKMFAQRKLSKD